MRGGRWRGVAAWGTGVWRVAGRCARGQSEPEPGGSCASATNFLFCSLLHGPCRCAYRLAVRCLPLSITLPLPPIPPPSHLLTLFAAPLSRPPPCCSRCLPVQLPAWSRAALICSYSRLFSYRTVFLLLIRYHHCVCVHAVWSSVHLTETPLPSLHQSRPIGSTDLWPLSC